MSEYEIEPPPPAPLPKPESPPRAKPFAVLCGIVGAAFIVIAQVMTIYWLFFLSHLGFGGAVVLAGVGSAVCYFVIGYLWSDGWPPSRKAIISAGIAWTLVGLLAPLWLMVGLCGLIPATPAGLLTLVGAAVTRGARVVRSS